MHILPPHQWTMQIAGWANIGSDTRDSVALRVNGAGLADLVRTAFSTASHSSPPRASSRRIWLRSTGDSMWPLLPHGSAVRLAPPPERPSDLRPGTIVLVERPWADGAGKYTNCGPVLHRVIGVRDGGASLLLKGDNLPRMDRPASAAAILAVVDSVAGRGGEVLPPPVWPPLAPGWWRDQLRQPARRLARFTVLLIVRAVLMQWFRLIGPIVRASASRRATYGCAATDVESVA